MSPKSDFIISFLNVKSDNIDVLITCDFDTTFTF